MGKRYFSLIIGIVFLLAGIAGFIPSFIAAPMTRPELVVDTGYGDLMGLFPINVLHNFVHLGVGAWGIVSYRSFESARIFSRGLAIFYGLLAFMGFIPGLNTTFGLIPLFGNNVWLHGVTALFAAYFGYFVPAAEFKIEK